MCWRNRLQPLRYRGSAAIVRGVTNWVLRFTLSRNDFSVTSRLRNLYGLPGLIFTVGNSWPGVR